MEAPTHDSPYDSLLETAVRAARRAASIIREQSGSPNGVRAKRRNDFVTETDKEAQAAAVEVLRRDCPDDRILAEEGGNSASIPAVVDGRRWIVDPLDGTTNFMHQVPPYAVSVALQEDDEIVAGVVLDVPHRELFTAVAGHGLQVNGQSAGVSPTEAFENAFLATGFPYRRFEHTEIYLDVLADILRDARSVRRHGSAAIDLAWLACGRFDGFFETGLQPWDVAAGILLVREGRGRVTNYHEDGELTPLFDQQVCATNGRVHQPLLRHLAPMDDVRL
ncbi:MAG: inositol monophosphatase [Salinibacter sp.]